LIQPSDLLPSECPNNQPNSTFRKKRTSVDSSPAENIKNLKGETSLHIFCGKETGQVDSIAAQKFEEELKRIKGRGGNVNPRDNNGNIPLHDAMHSRNSAALLAYMTVLNSKYNLQTLLISISD